jgi:hypothetical protein
MTLWHRVRFFGRCSMVALLICGFGSVHSQSIGRVASFNGLTWTFTTNVANLERCSRLQLDLMGDLDQASALSMHGFLNCAAINSNYGVVGSIYRLTTGTVQAVMFVGANVYFVCSLNASTFSGPCTAYIGSAVAGTGTMSLL